MKKLALVYISIFIWLTPLSTYSKYTTYDLFKNSGLEHQIEITYQTTLDAIKADLNTHYSYFPRKIILGRINSKLDLEGAKEIAVDSLKGKFSEKELALLENWFQSKLANKIVELELEGLRNETAQVGQLGYSCEDDIVALLEEADSVIKVLQYQFTLSEMQQLVLDGYRRPTEKSIEITNKFKDFYNNRNVEVREKILLFFSRTYNDLKCVEINEYVNFMQTDTGENLKIIFNQTKVNTLIYVLNSLCLSLLNHSKECSAHLRELNNKYNNFIPPVITINEVAN